jgi:hypothetical protein
MENGDVLLPLRELEKTEASVSPIIVRTSKYLGIFDWFEFCAAVFQLKARDLAVSHGTTR